MEVIGSLNVVSRAGVEEACAATAGLAAGLAWVGLELGLEGGGLAELDSKDLAGGRLRWLWGWWMMCWWWP